MTSNRRVVGTLTTLPTRYDRLEKTLQRLQLQSYKLDAIYLGLPKRAVRLGLAYPELPTTITNLCTVVPCEDKGPITKLSGALLTETDPQTLIISFDDDRTYPIDIVATLLKAYDLNPGTVICTTGAIIGYHPVSHAVHLNTYDYFLYPFVGFPIPAAGRPVDIIYGFSGVLYQRSFFPSVDKLEELWHYTTLDKELFRNDDITISGYLCLKNIPRIITSASRLPGMHSDLAGANPITTDIKTLYSAIDAAKAIGMFQTTVPLNLTELYITRLVVMLVVLLLLILLVVFTYQWFISKTL